MNMSKKYDLIVIGAGSGGLGAALGMHKLGLKVLLIDKEAKNIGGECLNTGCIPSKSLLHVAKQVHHAKASAMFGLEVQGKVELQKVKEYILQKQNSIRSHENVDYLREQGMDVVLGTASFVGNNRVDVQENEYSAKNIILATGSFPRTISIKGAKNFPVYTNESIFDIDLIPEHFICIGAGPVSLEIAQAFSRLGSKVSVVVRSGGILKKDDSEITEILLAKLQEEGIRFYFDSEVIEIRNAENAIIETASEEEKIIPVDVLFMGIGRELDFSSLNLDKAGIQTKDGKILLNDKLQTTNKNIFVSGDAAGNLKFSHAAEMHNMLLINNFISPKKKKLNFEHFPWVTFTEPEIATFGINEQRLKEKNKSYERLVIDFSEVDRGVTDDFEYGKLVLFIEKKRLNPGNAKILGGSMIAPNAGEITQELILANVSELKIKHFMNKIYAYPTAANIHKTLIRNRLLKELNPWMKKLIRTWYRFKK